MQRNELIEAVKSGMPARRWSHTLGVMETAVRLAERYGADPARAELAAILHDAAKAWPIDEQRRFVMEHGLAQDELDYDPELLHAPIAAYLAETRYGITDREVLDAIRYHTTGRERMTLLEKVVCLADYIEPGRDFPGVHEIRRLAESNLEGALVAGFDGTISFLLARRKKIFPLTVAARNRLLEEWNRREAFPVQSGPREERLQEAQSQDERSQDERMR